MFDLCRELIDHYPELENHAQEAQVRPHSLQAKLIRQKLRDIFEQQALKIWEVNITTTFNTVRHRLPQIRVSEEVEKEDRACGECSFPECERFKQRFKCIVVESSQQQ